MADFAKFIKFDKAGRNHKNIKKLSLNEFRQLKERIIYGPTAEPYRPVRRRKFANLNQPPYISLGNQSEISGMYVTKTSPTNSVKVHGKHATMTSFRLF